MNLLKYTIEQLKEAVKTSYSYRQTLIKVGVVPAGGNYATLKKAVQHFNLDISHFTGQAWNKGKIMEHKRPLEDYLSNKQTINSHKLRKRLLSEGIFEPVCASCSLTMWLGEPIPLELDHIDGARLNNELTNLRLLCPNCHAKTSTYRGKNQARAK